MDDGVPSRGHRLCVLDPAYTTLGACVGEHSRVRVRVSVRVLVSVGMRVSLHAWVSTVPSNT